ncbi:hypothetical protein ACV2M4_001095 [Shigella sonnei]
MYDDIKRRYDFNHDRIRSTGSDSTGNIAKSLINSMAQARSIRMATRVTAKK